MLYKLNKPFMTRVGQFEPNRSTLVVGILERVLLESNPDENLYMTMGNSPTIYYQKYGVLLNARHTIWINREGKRVRITPVSEFEIRSDPPLVQEPKVEPLSLFA